MEESYPSIEYQFKILKEEMETYFRHFNTFIDFVNAKLDANKDENVYQKISALKKENE